MSTQTLNGSCLCGKITLKIDVPPAEATPKIAICHCTTCKKYTGCPFSTNLIIPPEWISYSSGTPKTFMDNSTDSGNPIPRELCGECGCHFTSTPKGLGWTAFKWGVLDEDARKLCSEVGGEIYCKRREGWVDSLAKGGHGGFVQEAM